MPDAIPSGLLVIGHGTREPQGIADFRMLVDHVARMLDGVPVESAFLELAEPTILAGVERLARRGVRRIHAMPMLLFAAGHVLRDIPNALAVAAAAHPAIQMHQLSHLGCHPRVLSLSTQRYCEAVSGQTDIPPEDTLLVMVGRGSRDPRATEEMRQFARLRLERTPVERLEIGFLAMERPSLDEVLARVGAVGAARIIVQPHLLLPGCLVQRVCAKVTRARRQWRRSEWIVAESLGPDRLLAQAVVDVFSSGAGRQNPRMPAAVN